MLTSSVQRLLLAAIVFVDAGNTVCAQPASSERLDEVVRRGVEVMPFDLQRTIHIFSKTASGGVQQVLAKESVDQEQIVLIRRHLSEISEHFRRGDFSSPERIHGASMPGLAELAEAELGKVSVRYRELPGGAEIRYSSEDPALVRAIHRWFDAQLSDHGPHAVPHRGHHEKMHRR